MRLTATATATVTVIVMSGVNRNGSYNKHATTRAAEGIKGKLRSTCIASARVKRVADGWARGSKHACTGHADGHLLGHWMAGVRRARQRRAIAVGVGRMHTP